jgi:hypothetical protein
MKGSTNFQGPCVTLEKVVKYIVIYASKLKSQAAILTLNSLIRAEPLAHNIPALI